MIEKIQAFFSKVFLTKYVKAGAKKLPPKIRKAVAILLVAGISFATLKYSDKIPDVAKGVISGVVETLVEIEKEAEEEEKALPKATPVPTGKAPAAPEPVMRIQFSSHQAPWLEPHRKLLARLSGAAPLGIVIAA